MVDKTDGRGDRSLGVFEADFGAMIPCPTGQPRVTKYPLDLGIFIEVCPSVALLFAAGLRCFPLCVSEASAGR